MYTLVVVDMQAKFPPSLGERVLTHCKKAVARAVKNKAPIIFLEFEDYGPTLPQLMKLVRGYDKVYHASKKEWSGYPQINSLAKAHNLPTSKFKVCGVYTDCCVKATVKDLQKHFIDSRIAVLHKACSTGSYDTHNFAINGMSKLDRVRVVEA